MLAALLAQSSLLVAPLYLGDAPPETRAVAAIRFADDLVSEQIPRPTFDAWDDFGALARLRANNPLPDCAGLFGTFSQSMLRPKVAAFVFTGPVNASGRIIETWEDPINGALETGGGFVVKRLERDAACRQIFVAGTDAAARAKIDAIQRELANGADFAQLARERSEDRASALRGGDLAIFEREPDDALLREAAFRAKVGEVVGPIASPLGLHLIQRVPVEALDPRLRDDVWARARAILIANEGAKGADPSLHRSFVDAQRLADELAARIRRGDDMAALARGDDMIALAREHTDDRGGRERAGDLGWVRRNTTHMPPAFDRLFLEPPGDLIGPLVTEFGIVLLRREDPGLRSRIVIRRSDASEDPARQADEALRARFLATHGAVLDACLDDAMTALGVRDPRLVVDVDLRAAPQAERVKGASGVCVVSVEDSDVDRALERIIATALWLIAPGLDATRATEQSKASAARAIAIGRR